LQSVEQFGAWIEEDEPGVVGRPGRHRVDLGEQLASERVGGQDVEAVVDGDWDRAARETAAILRSAAGRDPHDRDLSDLVGELATQSEAFRTHWAAHDVRFHATAVKHLTHPIVGELSLSFNRLDIAADHGLTIFTYAAEPGSRSEQALQLLGSWAATLDAAETARATDTS
jgi:hypothetical protein